MSTSLDHFNTLVAPIRYRAMESISQAPDHFVIQMETLPKKVWGDPLPCAVCIVHDAHHDYPTAVNRALSGSIRCCDHIMRCATCRGYVQDDSHICCRNCWTVDRLKEIVHKGTVEALLIEGRICRYHQTPLTHSEQRGCSCLQCKRMLVAAVEARALEEGQADRLSPPNSCESPHVAVSFALDGVG